jgi:hypothetical protein
MHEAASREVKRRVKAILMSNEFPGTRPGNVSLFKPSLTTILRIFLHNLNLPLLAFSINGNNQNEHSSGFVVLSLISPDYFTIEI